MTDSSAVAFAVNSSEKSENTSLVEIRNGKVILKQKSSSFEKHSVTLQEIVKFRQMLESRVDSRDPPLTAIPDEHKPLIAKLAHESDKTISILAKHIQHELIPAQDEDGDTDISVASLSILPLKVVEAAIKSIMVRNNYGLDRIPGSGKVPAALCVWRWEVRENYVDWLPKNSREKAEVRMAERLQAKKDLAVLFESLSQETKETIVGLKGANKVSGRERDKLNKSSVVTPTGEAEILSNKQTKKQHQKNVENEEENDQSEGYSWQSEPERQKNSARLSKERQEKKFIKAEKEKKTKEEVLKSRSILTNFFGKARTIDCASSLGSTAVAGPSSSQSDFGKTFKPFVLKKDTDLAPINWFISAKRRSAVGRTDVIVIDDEEDTKAKGIDTEDVQQAKVDVGSMDARGRLYSILSCLPHSADLQVASQSLPSPASGEMTNGLTVRGIIAHLTEAEIAGDVSLVRALLSKLRNRKLVPAKVLIFAEDARPGYFGTWTRASDVIGPRKPFSKDPVVLDYAYDSGEEWEEEGMGEADDVVEDEEDEPDDVESDSDSWLDDDAAPDDGTLLGSRPTSPSILPPAPGQKRKSVDSDQILGKKRKVIAPLAPFARGPYWESTIGRCEYDPFKPYRIHIFNDTPFPIDPFTFVADSVQECRLSTRDNPPSDVVFLMPSLPERLSVVKSNTTPAPGLPSSAPAPNRRTPKTSFPDAHLPLLLAKISSLATGSIAFLVESIYQDLSGQNVKKNAIEAKVKEVGERCRDKKIWVVKSGVVS